jgi:F-type H+-transporting ATPase subunit delta
VAADSSTVAGIAGRYATALFDLAKESGQIDAIGADLQTVQAAIDQSEDLRRLIASPLFDRDQQGRAMAAVLVSLGVGQTVRNLVGLVARNRRLFALGAIIRIFGDLVAKHRGETTARVVAAQPLSPAQSDALAQALARAVGRNVRVETRVDPSLLGGLVVRVGSRQVDSSLKTKLASLSVAMKGVG